MFKVECPGCRAPYQVDERRVPSNGLKMRCPKCTTSFKVDPPAAAQGGAVLGAALGGGQGPPKAGAALGGGGATPGRRPGVTMLGVAPASSAPPGSLGSSSVDLPSVAGAPPATTRD